MCTSVLQPCSSIKRNYKLILQLRRLLLHGLCFHTGTEARLTARNASHPATCHTGWLTASCRQLLFLRRGNSSCFGPKRKERSGSPILLPLGPVGLSSQQSHGIRFNCQECFVFWGWAGSKVPSAVAALTSRPDNQNNINRFNLFSCNPVLFT